MMVTPYQSHIAEEELKTKDEAALNSNWNLPSYFGRIVVLTTDRTSNRFKRCQQELASVGLQEQQYEVFPGVKGSGLIASQYSRMESWDIKKGKVQGEDLKLRQQGQMGCLMTHYEAIKAANELYKKAKAALDALQTSAPEPTKETKEIEHAQKELQRTSSVLLIEDNNAFGTILDDKSSTIGNCGKRFRLAMRDLQPDWDMFYFMSMHGAKRVTQHIAKLERGEVLKCYAVNAKMYEKILTLLESKLSGSGPINPVDKEIGTLHKETNCFVATPPLTYRFASTSEVFSHLHKADKYDWSKVNNWQSQVELT